MCGILGSINIPIENSILNTIKHRGPDDFGTEQFDVNGNKVQFCHRRLAIIDLSAAGHQPMITACKHYSIIFNGEIYNHRELRKRLPASINYNGHSDTETILYYLREFGIDGAKDFNGIFAFAFLNHTTNKLYLVRDPFGVKPLYFHHAEDNQFLFASEMRPIRLLLKKRSLNKQALSTLLRLRYNPSPYTLIKQIEKIKPGHYLKIDLNNALHLVEHHAYLSEVSKSKSYPKSKVVSLYGQKLEEAVTRQLMSDVEIGVLLSGGIDSAMVAALAKKQYKGKLKAFTIGFEGNYDEDEIKEASETAELLDLEHYSKKINFFDFLSAIKECTRIVEEPLATTSIIPMYYLSELAAKRVKVILTGQGADEPLGGYIRYKSELVRSRTPKILQGLIHYIVSRTNLFTEQIIRGVKSLPIKNDIERFLVLYEIFERQEIFDLISVEERDSSKLISHYYDLLNLTSRKDPVERMMALDSRLNLADDLLNYTDKITMNFSVECRVPMLDLELVKFIESLPLELKLNIRSGKLIHKQFAREVLPSRIINRKKKAFKSPTSLWFRDEVTCIREMLLNGNTHFSEIFNQVKVAEIINQHVCGFNKEKQIFLLLSIFFWLESFADCDDTYQSSSYFAGNLSS